MHFIEALKLRKFENQQGSLLRCKELMQFEKSGQGSVEQVSYAWTEKMPSGCSQS